MSLTILTKPEIDLPSSTGYSYPTNASKLIVIGLEFYPDCHFSKFMADYWAGNGGYKSD